MSRSRLKFILLLGFYSCPIPPLFINKKRLLYAEQPLFTIKFILSRNSETSSSGIGIA